VQVRTKEEIRRHWDRDGRLDELPFMPEMLPHCGRKMRVGNGSQDLQFPRSASAAERWRKPSPGEYRCNGSAHDGCGGMPDLLEEACSNGLMMLPATWTLVFTEWRTLRCGYAQWDMLHSRVKIPAVPGEVEPTYLCQKRRSNSQPSLCMVDTAPDMWRIPSATSLPQWQPVCCTGLAHDREAGVGVGSAMRLIYDTFQQQRGATPYPIRPYGVPIGTPGSASATRSAAR